MGIHQSHQPPTVVVICPHRLVLSVTGPLIIPRLRRIELYLANDKPLNMANWNVENYKEKKKENELWEVAVAPFLILLNTKPSCQNPIKYPLRYQRKLPTLENISGNFGLLLGHTTLTPHGSEESPMLG